MNGFDDLAELFSVSDQHFWAALMHMWLFLLPVKSTLNSPFASHGHDPDCVLWVGVDFGAKYSGDSVGLCLETGRLIVSVPHVL